MLNSTSSWISLIVSSALGIFVAAVYLTLFKRSIARALKSPRSFNPAWTLSGLFIRLTLIGLVLFLISRIHSVNIPVVLINFAIMIPILVIWMARDFSRQLIHHK